ncbi:RluA family pseudouridine synthase [Bacillus thermotolerans]|uniref:Pseudouridine synthase n=1 Tax=Bacillus thermotolerans TaxID=1221996 RepID=A0A0F5HXK0_BACTR|nr:RluA family pseudouridine synthase [Bacillus thermotolerans]KKB38104.1 ribosomal large subunit pseudouridine synthase D like proteinYjbO type [Bacillus thermotolerans]KKB40767.1 ribosomal large subunit pseudouridine synthase D like protein [Bacillus thermotolerans]
MGFQLTWQASASDQGKLLREFLAEQQLSRRALTDIKFEGGLISVNGREVNVRYVLQEGDEVAVIFPEERPSEGIQREDLPLSVVYEDDYLLVIAKPPGMNTIPSREHPAGSLANGLLGYYAKQGIQATAHIVTRLDRDTSGLVLIAKHRHVHHLCSQMQQEGRISRAYEALADGMFARREGVIEEPIGRKPSSIIEREVREDGQYACTAYEVVRVFRNCTHVRLKLYTGRTHQIRVHLSYMGHPLLGDDLYGGPAGQISRQALHCGQLSFQHPMTKEQMSFSLPLPEDMKQVIDQLEE